MSTRASQKGRNEKRGKEGKKDIIFINKQSDSQKQTEWIDKEAEQGEKKRFISDKNLNCRRKKMGKKKKKNLTFTKEKTSDSPMWW